MRKRGRWFGVLSILLCMCMLCACKGKEEEASQESTHVQTVALSSLDMSSYVRLGVYEGLTIALDSADASRGDAVFAAVMETSEILAYPEDQVAYYAEQQRAAYRYYAKQKGASYEEILKANGETEEGLLAKAKELTAKDLVYHAIVQAEQITLTEEEKATHFDRYVTRFVQTYGYGEAYVRENMREQIYDSMLYDKTLEKLITLNTFSVKGE